MALSFEQTGKYTSERHQSAKEAGKLTAGEAGKMISKIVGEKIYAKEIVQAYKLINGYDPEWHHSGFYSGNQGKTMGRTFFFSESQIEDMAANWNKVLAIYDGKKESMPENLTACTRAVLKRAQLFEGKKYYGWDEPKIDDFSLKIYRSEIEKREEIKRKEEERVNQWEEAKKLEVETQEKANRILDDMKVALLNAGVNFSAKNAAWYIYSKFIQGTPNELSFSVGKVNKWINSQIL